MKRVRSQRCAAVLALGCLLLPSASSRVAGAQEEGSPTAVLLSRARTLEGRGRLDLAKQDWAQVLQLQPDDAEALGGLVRAARAEHRTADAAQYLARLRATHPNDPQVSRLENAAKGQESGSDLAEAARLSRAGDNRAAFAIYRRIYGVTPPPGAPALAYYGAEAATEEGRPQAIAGLRALSDAYPAEPRYSLALGRTLLASPRTRAEGRTLLERYPGNPEAVAALRGTPSGTDVASSGGVPASPRVPGGKPSPATPLTPPVAVQHSPTAIAPNDRGDQLSTVTQPPRAPGSTPRATFRTTSGPGAPVHHGAYAAQEQAGFAALNGRRTADAEQIFQDILAKDPTNPRALAGLGYARVSAGDLKTAVVFFERAQENGDHSLALTRALVNTQFDLTLKTASAARTRGDLPDAEIRYRAALGERPGDPDALEGLGGLLLQSGRADAAVPVFVHLTQVRPMSPAAWRGLVISQASAGRPAEALASDSHVPADARPPLQGDPSYEQALTTARGAQSAPNTQVAKAEPPPVVRAPVTPAERPRPLPPVSPAPAPTTAAPLVKTPSATSVASAPTMQPVAPPQPVKPSPAPPSPGPQGVAVEPPKASSSPSAPKQPVSSRASGKKAARPASPAKPSTAVVASAPAIVATPPPPQPRGEEVIAAERTTQGEAALSRGEDARAAELFREAATRDPARPSAWKGLVGALHAEGKSGEAHDVLERIPPGAHEVLGLDATFLATAGEVYLASERPDEALHAYARAQAVFATQKLSPPLDIVLRITALLAAREDDGNLYRELVYLGDRRDLNDSQRRDVQMIWTGWAVRRARTLAAAGEQARAVTVLNAAAAAFAGNAEVLNAVAKGYAGVGLPREAVALYKAKDLSAAPASELEAAVGAGIAAHDFKTAEGWARLGRERFPSDPEMLTVTAELEQARGHEGRAVELARQARALAPAQDPGQVLTAELREASAGHGWRKPSGGQLAVLLSPADALSAAAGSSGARPFLPALADTAGNQRAAGEIPALAGYDEPAR